MLEPHPLLLVPIYQLLFRIDWMDFKRCFLRQFNTKMVRSDSDILKNIPLSELRPRWRGQMVSQSSKLPTVEDSPTQFRATTFTTTTTQLLEDYKYFVAGRVASQLWSSLHKVFPLHVRGENPDNDRKQQRPTVSKNTWSVVFNDYFPTLFHICLKLREMLIEATIVLLDRKNGGDKLLSVCLLLLLRNFCQAGGVLWVVIKFWQLEMVYMVTSDSFDGPNISNTNWLNWYMLLTIMFCLSLRCQAFSVWQPTNHWDRTRNPMSRETEKRSDER